MFYSRNSFPVYTVSFCSLPHRKNYQRSSEPFFPPLVLSHATEFRDFFLPYTQATIRQSPLSAPLTPLAPLSLPPFSPGKLRSLRPPAPLVTSPDVDIVIFLLPSPNHLALAVFLSTYPLPTPPSSCILSSCTSLFSLFLSFSCLLSLSAWFPFSVLVCNLFGRGMCTRNWIEQFEINRLIERQPSLFVVIATGILGKLSLPEILLGIRCQDRYN